MTIVLGIDPGYERLGMAILEREGGKERIIYSETFQTSKELEFKERLLLLGKKTEDLLEKYEVQFLSIEKLFFNTNAKTATNVSEVRGALIYIALARGLNVFEYTPLEIKVAITGYGRSDKKQVIFMLRKLIEIKKEIKYDDEYDAIATAMTFLAYNQNL